jgi:hypothetical protein
MKYKGVVMQPTHRSSELSYRSARADIHNSKESKELESDGMVERQVGIMKDLLVALTNARMDD